MSKFNREEMVAEATDLGLDFKGNISNLKLAELLADFKGEPPPVEEAAPAGPAVKAEEPSLADDLESQDAILTSAKDIAKARVHDKYQRKRAQIAAAKKKAFKTQIVTITSKDTRENDVVTTAFLSVQNQYFKVARSVPLDIPVELEQCLINNAESALITLHKDEVVNGRRTGNKQTMRVKKYAISYSGRTPD